MDKDRAKGAMKKVTGATKEAAGKLTGNLGLQAKGAAEKTAGKVQDAAGKAKDKMRDETRRAH